MVMVTSSLRCTLSLLAIIAAGFAISFFTSTNHSERFRRQLVSSVATFHDPKTVQPRPLDTSDVAIDKEKCLVVYLVAVEGSGHHGFLPVLDKLYESQLDPDYGKSPYIKVYDEGNLRDSVLGNNGFVRKALFRSKGVEIDDRRQRHAVFGGERQRLFIAVVVPGDGGPRIEIGSGLS